LSALDLIARLRELGVKIGVDGDDLLVDAPQGVVTPELAAEIRERKVQIVAMLKWSARSKRSAELPLEPADRSAVLPLSYAQQRLWFLDQLEPDSASYNISWTVRLKGELDVPALQQSVNTLVARHEVLRCSFPARDGDAETIIHDSVDVVLEQSDLPGSGDERMRAYLSKLAASPFDLSKPPLIRFFLVRLNEAEHVLLVLIHHIISDGASMRILFRELASCYDAYTNDEVPEFEALSVQYPDYAVWQRRWLEGEQLEQQMDYWLDKLKDAPPVLTLPSDRPRSAALRFRGASVVRVLPRALAEELRGLGRSCGATLFMVMFAAFDVLLERYSGQRDLVVGTPIGGRPRTSLEGLIGFFVNTAVLRVDVEEAGSFRDLVRQVRDTALEMHTNQELPFEKLVEVLQPERELSHTPVFQVMFDLQEEPRWKLPVRNLEVLPEVIFSSRTSTFDLTLSVREAENGLDAMFEYDTDLFDESTIERFALHYQNLLEAVLANPDKPLADIPMLDEAERRKLLHEWNPSDDVDTAETLTGLFARSRGQYPDSPALETGDGVLSYSELDEQSGRVARALADHDVGSGDVVGIYAARGAETVAAILGVLKVGAAWLPLDPDYPVARLRAMADVAQPRMILVAEGLKPRFNANHLVLNRELLDAGPVMPAVNTPAELPACILFTSGSTGVPKGVSLSHGGLSNYVDALRNKTALSNGSRVLQFASLNFDISIEEMFVAFAAGATLVLRGPGAVPDVRSYLKFLAERSISWVSLPTAYWNEIASELNSVGSLDGLALKTVVIGGEKAQLEHWKSWREHLPQAQLLNTYGPTETSIAATWYDLSFQQPDSFTTIPIGTPVPGVQAYVLNSNMQPQPIGVPGELYIGGVGVAHGYINPPEQGDAFVSNPFADGRLYRSGDSARFLPDGNLEYLGRVDEQLKLRGHRIEPADIESALLSHPQVETCAVVPVAGAADITLAAYVAAPPDKIDSIGLRAYLRSRLPDYMVPDIYQVMEVLPLTVNGKVDRAALPEVSKSRLSETPFRMPETAIEKDLAAIWSEVLNLSEVGLDDNFFELGGHSLLATRVVARIRDALNKDVPLRLLFDSPTVAGLANAISYSTADSGAPIRPRRDSELPPLSFSQQRLWFLEQLEPGSSGFNLPWMVRLKGALDKPVLQDALNQLMQRHEALRTSFADVDGEAVQVVAASQQLPLVEVSLNDATDELINDCLQERIAGGFDVAQGPLIRASLIRVSEHDHVLLLVMHHIVSDGWSVGIIQRELSEFYNAALRGQAPGLQPLTVQYADYAIWQQTGAAQLTGQLDYWREQLSDMPPLLDLVSDRPRPALQSYAGGWRDLRLSKELSAGLRQLATQYDASVFMLLLAVFNILMGRYAGRDDIIIGTPVAGRRRTELEGLVGFFLNTLVVRSNLAGNPGFDEYLRQVKSAAIAAFDNQDVPFERLIEELQPERNPAFPPIVQVMFNLHNFAESGSQSKSHSGDFAPDGVTVQPFNVASGVAKFDLNVSVFENADGGFRLGMEYSSALFDAGTIEQMLLQYEALLQAVVKHPQATLAELPIPGGVRSTGPELNPDVSADTVASRFVAQAKRSPDAPAIDDGKQVLTYSEVLTRAQSVAAHLCVSLPAEAQRVGVLFEPGADAVIAMLAIALAGRTWVALDIKQPAARLQVVADQAHGIVAADEFAQLAGDLSPAVCRWSECRQGDPHKLSARTVSADDLAYILFTSGTTGQPKGVMQTHAGLLAHIDAYAASVTLHADDRLSLLSSYAFDAALMDIFAALLNGACLCPVSLLDTPEPLNSLVERNVSVLHATPTVFRILLKDATNEPLLSSVRTVVLGGEAASQSDFDLFRKHFTTAAVFINGLGPSESTTALQFKAKHETRLSPGLLPVGQAVSDTEVWLEDGKGNPAVFNGEIVIRSKRVSPGYLGESAASNEVYRTGDYARWLPDGNLVFTGRQDGRIKLRGQRIETAEIAVLLESYPGIAAAVVSLRDFRGQPELVAWYVPENSGVAISDADCRDELRLHLPESLVPVSLVPVDGLPLLSNGKLNIQALPDPEVPAVQQLAPPETKREEMVAEIWKSVLGIEQIGRDDDFFALGGHSLLATRVIARMRDQLQSDVSLRSLFTHPVLRAFAAESEKNSIADELPLQRQSESRRKLAPLSWSQQRLWFLDQLEPENPGWNLHRALRIRGELDVSALQAALDVLVARHESLRTGFASRNNEPVQLVGPVAAAPLIQIELNGANDELLHDRCLELVRQPFSLQGGPLFRATLIHVGPDDAVLLLIMHHIVSDGWSIGVLCDELSTLYADRNAVLPVLDVQYRDYAIWQRDWLQNSEAEEQAAYWRTKLTGVPPVLELPLDHPRPVVPAHRGAWVRRQLSTAQLQSLNVLSQEQGATLFMTLLAVFKVVLARYSGREDIVVGTPVAGRNRTGLEPLIGFFLNTLVLRTGLEGNPVVAEVIQRVKETALGAYDHQSLPFEKLIEILQPARSLSIPPLVQVMFNLHNEFDSGLNIGAEVESFHLDRGTSKSDLAVSVVEGREGLSIAVEYDTDIFDASTMEAMLDHYVLLLDATLSDASQKLSSLPRPASTQAVINGATVTESDALHILDAFGSHVRVAPDSPAVVTADHQWSYSELDARANRVARNILDATGAATATADLRAGLLLGHDAPMLAGLLGTLKAGCTYVPLDPEAPRERLLSIVSEAAVNALVVAPQFSELARSLSEQIPVVVVGEDLPSDPVAAPDVVVSPDSLAYILFTSGSTGTPKGVMQTHRNVLQHARTYRDSLKLTADDSLSLLSPYGFDAAVMDIYASLLTGACLRPFDLKNETFIGAVIGDIAASNITVLHATPTVFRYLMRHKICRHDVTKVRAVVLGGEEAKISDFEFFLKNFDESAVFVNGLGPSECTLALQWFGNGQSKLVGNQVPVGAPVNGVEVLLVDEHLGVSDIAGEILLSADAITPGYWNAPDLTERAFVTIEGKRWYRTGDRGRYLPDGTMLFAGRRDEQIKLRGHRIEPGEIESLLIEHERVDRAVVMLRDDLQGNARLVTWVVAKKKESVEAGELRSYLKERLPRYMMPSAIVVLEGLPLTSNGKVNRAALPDPKWGRNEDQMYVAPRSDTETQLTQLWSEVLGVGKVGVHDDFFDLGGHSLLAMQLISRVTDTHSVGLPLRKLFDGPTIAEMAKAIDDVRWTVGSE